MSKIDTPAIAFTIAHTSKEISDLEERLFDVLEDVSTIEGPIGARGPQGARGERGDNGDKGDKGDVGETGPKGEKGDQGLPGVAGDPGPKGDTGAQGVKGDTGDTGLRGSDGLAGPKGEKGDTGAQGPKGETGSQGVKGDRGDQGPKGDTGATGDRGPQGLQGIHGKKGDRGEQGIPGAVGPIGAPGPIGETGAQGEPGVAPNYREEFENALDAFNTRLTENAKRVDGNIQKQIDKINRSLGTLGGGGSYKLVDNADVDKAAIKGVVENAILIYDPVSKKFKAESFINVLDRLKAELEVQYNRLIDTDGQFIYIGEALPGTATSEAKWRIKRVDQKAGDDYDIIWADGTAELTKVWDDRLTLSYV